MDKDYSPLVNKVIDTLSLGRGLAHEVKYNPDDCFMEYQYRMIHKLKRGVRTTLKAMGESFDIPHDYDKLHNALVDLELNVKVWDKLKWKFEI